MTDTAGDGSGHQGPSGPVGAGIAGPLSVGSGIEAMAITRMAIGAVLLVVPGLTLRLCLGRDASTPAGKWLARAAGGRDLAMGLGLLLASRHGTPVRGWLEAGAMADATDALAALLAMPKLGKPRSLLIIAAAAGGAAAGRKLVAALPADEGGNGLR